MTRFDLDMDGSMEPSENGRWVRYEDVVQRECQGLTDDEIALISAECSLRTPSDIYFARAIEAKLKERNT
jgi:hypothetical protein